VDRALGISQDESADVDRRAIQMEIDEKVLIHGTDPAPAPAKAEPRPGDAAER
jgi:hypothetical protein